MEIPVIVFMAGCSGMGKTTILLQIVRQLKKDGLKIGVVKHAGYVEEPAKTKDSYKYAHGGADVVAVVSPTCYQISAVYQQEPSLEQIIQQLPGYHHLDLVLVEGYKNSSLPKIEICRQNISKQLYTAENDLLAVISDLDCSFAKPCFALNDITGICAFIKNYLVCPY